MEFKLALAQCRHPEDGDTVALVDRYARAAAERGAALAVFPECLMTPYEKTPEDFAAAAQPLDGPFAHAVNAVAASCHIWIVYTVNERNPHSSKPFNTAVAVDDEGELRGAYRKTHLFDTAEYRESSKMSPGAALFDPIDTPFGHLGLGICYDLRFPEVSRHAALRGCDLMLYPAAWVSGAGKVDQWRTLLRARAIENECFVAGLSRPDEGYIGSSAVYGPTGEALAQAGSDEEMLVCTLDTDALVRAREQMPLIENRRTDLY